DDRGLRFDLAAEASRPGVSLDAQVRESRAYARAMLALYAVVGSDHRPAQRDHSAYQAWVQERYLEELPEAMTARHRKLPEMILRRKDLTLRLQEKQKEIRALEMTLEDNSYWKAVQRYFKWLLDHAKDEGMVLEPVLGVH